MYHCTTLIIHWIHDHRRLHCRFCAHSRRIFGGSLKDFTPAELGALAAREVIVKACIKSDQVGQTMFGQVIPTEPADAYLARVVSIRAGVHHEAPAMTQSTLRLRPAGGDFRGAGH